MIFFTLVIYGHIFSFLLYTYLEVEFLDHGVQLTL